MGIPVCNSRSSNIQPNSTMKCVIALIFLAIALASAEPWRGDMVVVEATVEVEDTVVEEDMVEVEDMVDTEEREMLMLNQKPRPNQKLMPNQKPMPLLKQTQM